MNLFLSLYHVPKDKKKKKITEQLKNKLKLGEPVPHPPFAEPALP